MLRRGLFALAAVLLTIALAPTAAALTPTALTIDGGPLSEIDQAPVRLDADLYLPSTTPAPAVVLAHGFGGSKESLITEAEFLVDRGFVVLAYTARGFGSSTGTISMNAPQFEVADAASIIDYLASLERVVQDAPGDPRVGFAGGSYGGALSLMIAGYDDRVDAISADITWNDLQTSLFGQSAIDSPDVGVFKQLWSGLFFSAGLTTNDGQVTDCGRFSPDWCAAYSAAAAQGVLTDRARELMASSSPASITDRITVPTLLGGGQSDSLFPLGQVNANAEQIGAVNPNVKVVWHAGGHDGGVNESTRLRELNAQWFQAHLAGGPAVSDSFDVSLVEASAFGGQGDSQVEVLSRDSYPGIFGETQRAVPIAGSPQQVLAPAGGVPAAISSLPGAGGLAALADNLLALPLPNQSATFVSNPLAEPARIIGSSTVTVGISSQTPVRDVTLFASLRIIGATDRPVLPQGLVAPLLIDSIGPEPTIVQVELPAIVADVAAGERLALVIGTTDQAYRMPPGPAVYTISLATPNLSLPVTPMDVNASSPPVWLWPLVAIIVCAFIAIIVRLLRPKGAKRASQIDLTNVPIAVEGLSKQFKGGVHAVSDVSFHVPRGVVLGLLGPNGAGKTTTMRMVMGLIFPTGGNAYVFGQPVFPGAATLAHIGSFIEGPGFLPHLSGRENLRLYWQASGRERIDPQLDYVLGIAGLGSAIDRKVRTYSQGMRQRLGIAQAMLGMPDVLVLDEPTNGLDPPQIREMRQVLKDYAATGRTVVISSHLLSEVEQTCSHVVVMHHGTLIAQGTVAELLAGRSGARLEDVFMEIVGEGHEVVTS
ncbi:MAG: alpha/beta fold hydrolase [Candidatus Nanopelagicales bacterium]